MQTANEYRYHLERIVPRALSMSNATEDKLLDFIKRKRVELTQAIDESFKGPGARDEFVKKIARITSDTEYRAIRLLAELCEDARAVKRGGTVLQALLVACERALFGGAPDIEGSAEVVFRSLRDAGYLKKIYGDTTRRLALRWIEGRSPMVTRDATRWCLHIRTLPARLTGSWEPRTPMLYESILRGAPTGALPVDWETRRVQLPADWS